MGINARIFIYFAPRHAVALVRRGFWVRMKRFLERIKFAPIAVAAGHRRRPETKSVVLDFVMGGGRRGIRVSGPHLGRPR